MQIDCYHRIVNNLSIFWQKIFFFEENDQLILPAPWDYNKMDLLRVVLTTPILDFRDRYTLKITATNKESKESITIETFSLNKDNSYVYYKEGFGFTIVCWIHRKYKKDHVLFQKNEEMKQNNWMRTVITEFEDNQSRSNSDIKTSYLEDDAFIDFCDNEMEKDMRLTVEQFPYNRKGLKEPLIRKVLNEPPDPKPRYIGKDTT